MSIDINVVMNPAYIPYLNKEQFLQIFFGGSSSGKSYVLSDKIVIDNMDGCNWLCCRNVANTIRRSIFNEVTKSISNMGLKQYYSISKSDMIITNKLNDKQILFCGLDDPEKVKSITPANGVLERIFIEEKLSIPQSYLNISANVVVFIFTHHHLVFLVILNIQLFRSFLQLRLDPLFHHCEMLYLIFHANLLLLISIRENNCIINIIYQVKSC